MLRCKENDLAVILSGPYTGFMITVGKYHGTVRGITISGNMKTIDRAWEVIGIEPHHGTNCLVIPDNHLQPIRGGKVPATTEKEMRA